MSQLERALRKARAAAEGQTATEDESLNPPVRHSAFVSAWDFSEPAEKTTNPAIGPAPSPAVRLATPPVKAVAPIAAPPPAMPEFGPAVRGKLVVGPEARPEIREQFGKIAAVLYRVRQAQHIAVVMIASAVPGEGKTLTSANLALTLSESYGSKVLLVDGDLRRPSVHSVFGISNKIGLKEKLSSATDSVAPVRISAHLSVLPAGSGSADPMGLLISDRMASFVRQASEEFDWVILDTPPVELLPDARILGAMADCALLVVQAGATKSELAVRTLETIGRDRVLGVVLNQTTERRKNTPYNYYGYYGTGPASSL